MLKTLAPQQSRKIKCSHCGDDCGFNPITELEQDLHFCCTGCQSVYHILQDSDLCYYYQISEQSGVKKQINSIAQSYAYLDQPEIQNQLLSFFVEEKAIVTFEIRQMHCISCIWLLEHLYKLNTGILSSHVDFLQKKVTIHYNPKLIKLSEIVRLLDSIGYLPRLNLDSLQTNKKQQKSNNRLIYQIGIAGFAFGNIMLLSFPDYLGEVAPPYYRLFSFLSLILSYPLFFYSAADYFKSAWNGIKIRRLNIDIPLALGMAMMFIRSNYEIISQTGTGYLDSLGGLIFFLLLGKFLQQKNYSFLAFDRDYRAYFPLAVQLKRQNNIQTVPITELKIGDTILIRNDEIIPADAILEASEAWIDYSFLSGESQPVKLSKGSLVYAGGRNVHSLIELVVSTKVEQSHLTQLWNQPSFFKPKQESLQRLINKINAYFTPAVITIATVSALFWLSSGITEAINAFTAVLIIACPCALMFASPFTYGHITRILGKYGFYLKNAEVVERLAHIDTIVFDKTGTLTHNTEQKVEFKAFDSDLTSEEWQLVATLARQSAHPLSRVIERQLQQHPSFENIKLIDQPGRGISLIINGNRVDLGSMEYVLKQKNLPNHNETNVHLSINNQYKGYFRIQQHFRAGIEICIQELKQDYQLKLLSGDSSKEYPNLKALFGEGNLFFNQSPEDKLNKIKIWQTDQKPIAMIGDGLNDAGALQESHIGISVTDDVSRFTPASDAIIKGDTLPFMPRFLSLAKKSQRIIAICFAVSLIYNLTGTYFAVQGKLTPMIAAILMPFSSIGIILLSTGLTYWAAIKLRLKV